MAKTKKVNLSSFVNERSVELVLIPRLIQELNDDYPIITPIHYWSNREGGIKTKESFAGKLLKVLAVYPRRPKVFSPGEGIIHVKFNEELFDAQRISAATSIPVIAGTVLIDKIEDLTLNIPCMWFALNESGSEDIVGLDLSLTNITKHPHIRSISIHEIKLLLDDRTQIKTWPAVKASIEEFKRATSKTYFHYRFAMVRYKPIFLLLHL